MHPETAIYDFTPTGDCAGHTPLIEQLGGKTYIKCPWNTGSLYPATSDVTTPTGLRLVEAVAETDFAGHLPPDVVRFVVLVQEPA
jgi:hypothetical protein